MTRLRLLLLLVALATLVTATPAQAGLLDSLLGSPDGEETSATPPEGAAGAACQPSTLPVVELGLGSCSGVRPGALAQIGSGMCTLNFLFEGDGRDYIGTAGHCLLGTSPLAGNNGEHVFAEGEGRAVTDSDGNRIGEFAYAIQEEPKDFGLIRLDEDVVASAQVRQFGGPTGVNDETTDASSTTLFLTGNPLGLGGPLAVGRPLVAADLSDPDIATATGVVLPGDSGGPVLDEQGRAVGSILGIGILGDSGQTVITRLTPQLEQAEAVMGIDLTLQTAPRL